MRPQLHDFGAGPVPASRHPNGQGWVACTAHVADTAWVAPGAVVFGKARVLDRSRVLDNAQVCDEACLMQDATVAGRAIISGRARLMDYSRVAGAAKIRDDAMLLDTALAEGDVSMKDRATLRGAAVLSSRSGSIVLSDAATVMDRALVTGRVTMEGSCCVAGQAMLAGPTDGILVRKMHLSGNACVLGHARVTGIVRMEMGACVKGDATVLGGDNHAARILLWGQVQVQGRSRLEAGTHLVRIMRRGTSGLTIEDDVVLANVRSDDMTGRADHVQHLCGAAVCRSQAEFESHWPVPSPPEPEPVEKATDWLEELEVAFPQTDPPLSDIGSDLLRARLEAPAKPDELNAFLAEVTEDEGFPTERPGEKSRSGTPHTTRLPALDDSDMPDGGLQLDDISSANARYWREPPDPLDGMNMAQPWEQEEALTDTDDLLELLLDETAKGDPDTSLLSEAPARDEVEKTADEAATASFNMHLSCKSKRKPSPRTGWAAVWKGNDGADRGLTGWFSGASTAVRNRAALMAAIEGLQALPEGVKVRIHCRNAYVIDGIRHEASGARQRGWRRKSGEMMAHDDLWRRLDAEDRKRDTRWVKLSALGPERTSIAIKAGAEAEAAAERGAGRPSW